MEHEHECDCELLLKHLLEMKDHFVDLNTQIEVQKQYTSMLKDAFTDHLEKSAVVWDQVDSINKTVLGIQNGMHFVFRFVTFMSVLTGMVATAWEAMRNNIKINW